VLGLEIGSVLGLELQLPWRGLRSLNALFAMRLAEELNNEYI